MWGDKNFRDVSIAQGHVEYMRCHLIQRGIRAGPIRQSPIWGYCNMPDFTNSENYLDYKYMIFILILLFIMIFYYFCKKFCLKYNNNNVHILNSTIKKLDDTNEPLLGNKSHRNNN